MVQESDQQSPPPPPATPLGLVVGNYCHDVLFIEGRPLARSLGGAASFISNVLDPHHPDSFLYVSKVGPDFSFPSVSHPPLPSLSPTTLFHAHFSGVAAGDRVLKRVRACDPILPGDLPPSSPFEFGVAAAVAGEILPETLDRLLELCRTVLVDVQGLIRTFDPVDGTVSLVPLRSTAFFPLLSRVGFLKASAEEAPFLDVEEARRLCCVIVTDGKEGCRVYWKDGEVRIPAFPAVEVDPTGAGDSFLGGFVVGLAGGLAVPDAALLGNFFGSITVGQIGVPKFDLKMMQAPLNSCSSWQLPNLMLNEEEAENQIISRYEHWISRHGRMYRDEHEKAHRFQIYRSNLQFINSFNALGLGYNLTDNKFADLTNEEFRAKLKCLGHRRKHKHEPTKELKLQEKLVVSKYQPNKPTEKNHQTSDKAHIPRSVDWRKKGAVTDVKQQGNCGSCWAFSAVAAIEGVNQIKTKKLVSLSEQELLDCDTKGQNTGCSGGLISTAFEFVKKNHGLTTESDYPYKGAEKSCNTKKLKNHSVTISGYKNVTANSEKSLLEAIAKQPVSVAIESAGITFQFYSKGVYSGPCGTNLDHAMTAVGYGSELGKKYWLVKNSWGTDWGENGYVRMRRDVSGSEGICGILKLASYPVM